MNVAVARRAFALALRRTLADPVGIVVSAGFYLLVTAAITSLWRAAAVGQGGAVAGYTGIALTWYVVASESVVVSQRLRLIEEVGTEIGSGAIEPELLRPASVVAVRLVAEVGAVVPRLVACVLTGAVYATVVAGGPPSAPALLLALPSLVLAVVCNLAAQHAFAGSSFWVRDAKSGWFLYHKLVYIVGGMLLPLEVLPDGLEHFARLTPFAAMAYAPARIASGHLEPHLLAEQAGWTVAAIVLALATFRAGEARLAGAGG